MRKSGQIEPPTLGGRRDLMRRFAMHTRKRSMKAMILIDQAQPRDSKSFWSINGNTTPPTEPPVAARPVAVPRRMAKKCAMADTAGVKISAVPSPPAKEKERRKCQYSGKVSQVMKSQKCLCCLISQDLRVELARPKVPATRKILPRNTSILGPLASKIGPICSPQKNEKKM